MTGEQFVKARKMRETTIDEYFFSESCTDMIQTVTKAEYDRFNSILGGVGAYYLLNADFIDDLDEDEMEDLKKEIQGHKGKYYLVDVMFRPEPATIKSLVSYHIMLPDEEVKGWETFRKNEQKERAKQREEILEEKRLLAEAAAEKGSDNDDDFDYEYDYYLYSRQDEDEDKLPEIDVVDEVTKEEYDKFQQDLTGLHARWIRRMAQGVINAEKELSEQKENPTEGELESKKD